MNYNNVKPFVKWAGGKTSILSKLNSKYPENVIKYCEPFVGGGAVLLDILVHKKPKEILINDYNKMLINTYNQIKINPTDMIKKLSELQEKYNLMSVNQQQEYYYELRDMFNNCIINFKHNTDSACLFIFLNKTCYNGLYRVNKRNLFNTSFGKVNKINVFDENNIKVISELLQTVQITSCDYTSTIDFIDSDTFVYLDPPYRKLNDTSNFSQYTDITFDDMSQIMLKSFIDKISHKGAKILLSNSDPHNTNISDNFFDDLYSDYNIERISVLRSISCNKRKNENSVNELLISNY